MSHFDRMPMQHAIYKGISGKNGVLQFDLKPFDANRIEEGMSRKEKEKAKKGTVFVDAAKAIGESVYDYENDIKFAMSEGDLAEFLVGTKVIKDENTKLVDIYHKIKRDGNEISKSMSVKQGRKDKKGMPTFMVSLSEKGGGQDKYVVVPVSAVEMYALRVLFEAAIPRIMGW
jgi:hypothetical protein